MGELYPLALFTGSKRVGREVMHQALFLTAFAANACEKLLGGFHGFFFSLHLTYYPEI